MTHEQAARSRWPIFLGLALVGLLVALGLRIFQPQLQPDLISRRQSYPDDVEKTFTAEKGDLFDSQPGSVAPPPDPAAVLAHYFVAYDADGFRRPIMEAERYPIIAIGDSMTEGVHAPAPWPDVLADELKTPVRNLGVGSYNPPDYEQVMHLFGTGEHHDWVAIGFFEGDDLVKADDDRPFTPPNEMREAFEAGNEPGTDTPDYGEGPWKYPIDTVLGGQTHPLAIFEFYLWWLNGLPEQYQKSQDLAVLRERLASIQADAGEACVLLVYIPDKSHVYLPFVTDPASQARVTESAWRVTLEESGELGLYEAPESFEALVSRLDSMSVVIEKLAQETELYFVNATGPLQEAAARGEETYCAYDTHLNQRGHQIIDEAVASAIKEHSECGL
jgi:hypothetical protein